MDRYSGGISLGYNDDADLVALWLSLSTFGIPDTGGSIIKSIEDYLADLGFDPAPENEWYFPDRIEKARNIDFNLIEYWDDRTETFLFAIAGLGFNVSGFFINRSEEYAWGYQSTADWSLESESYSYTKESTVAKAKELTEGYRQMREVLASGVDDAQKIERLQAIIGG